MLSVPQTANPAGAQGKSLPSPRPPGHPKVLVLVQGFNEVLGGSNHELTVAWFPMLFGQVLALIVFERSFE
jgi:hypothetical protein